MRQPADRDAVTPGDLFAWQARRRSDAIAVECAGEQLTYGQLDEETDRLARLLLAHGAGPEHPVAIGLRRSVRLVVALLAATKAGVPYVPVDPGHPAERNALILRDAAPALVLAVSGTPVPGAGDLRGLPHLLLDELRVPGPADVPSAPDADLLRVRPPNPQDIAYTLYTSGSTGTPKGVAVTYANILNLLRSFAKRLALRPEDRFLAVTTVGFDIAALELFVPLLSGSRLVLATEAEREPGRLARLIERQRITAMQATPSLWQVLLEEPVDLSGVRVLVGGEALPTRLARDLRHRAREVTNVYGPTETTIWSTAATLECEEHTERPPIGVPIDRTRTYVLDRELRPVEDGVEGELYIGGAGVARGYVNRPGPTAQRFVADPFGPPGTRMYRTGDLVRRHPDGNLEFLGRTDFQVKLRGFRIELGEIETVITRTPGITQAVALVREDRPGDKRLVVYTVPRTGHHIDPTTVRRHAAHTLPDYMVPAHIVVLDTMPLTPNGKVDRRALPPPDHTHTTPNGTPTTPQQATLCQLFADTLGLPHIGTHDNFFDHGGHSLLATRLISRIRTHLNHELTIRDLFEHPTVHDISNHLTTPTTPRPALAANGRPARVPLSSAQRRLWFLNRLEDAGATYNMPLALRLRGPLDPARLRAALTDLVARHESLRTVFPEADGEPWQEVLPLQDALPALPVVAAGVPGRLESLRAEFLHRGFDLAKQPPLRAQVFVTAPDEHLLVVVVHHIACDGWSMAPLARDLLNAYETQSPGPRTPGGDAGPLPVQYADYTLWQHRLLGDPDDPESLAGQQLEYWKEALRGLPEQLALPFDRPRPPRSSYAGSSVVMRVDAEEHRSLQRLARESGATVFMAFQSLVSVLLTRLGAGTDIPIGTPVAGRSDEALEDLIGFFVNTLVLRTDTSGDPSFTTLLKRVRDRDIEALSHQDLPFEMLVEHLRPARSLARHPFFQVLLVSQNNERVPFRLPDLDVEECPVALDVAKFDLSYSLDEKVAPDGAADGVEITVEYSTDLFDASTVQRLNGCLLRLLRAAVRSPHTPVSQLPLLSAEERRWLLVDCNATDYEVPGLSLPELVEAQVARSPEAVAVVHEQQSLTYAELNARANQFARALISRGAGPEQAVALFAPRSVELVVALLAVVKTGAAYLPVDTALPADRIAYMVQDAAPVCVVTTKALSEHVPAGTELVILDSEDVAREAAAQRDSDVLDGERTAPLLPAHPVYVIYTSGSTGRPKGVVLPAQALVNLMAWHHRALGGGPGTVTAQFASLSFDAAAQEIFSAFTMGKTLAVPLDDTRKDTEEFVRWLDRHRVNELFAPTPVVDGVAEAADRLGLALPHLVDIAQAGEALTLHSALGGFCAPGSGRRLHNYYGPTETHVVTAWTVPDTAFGSPVPPPIGAPIWNTRAYVLDEGLRPVPVGVPGELYLAGEQVARGYVNRPGPTAQRFVADPFGPPGTRMYRTGDLVRRHPDGNLEFLGRTDFQVKLRGFRIELGEIETVITRTPGITQAVALVREDRPGDKRLVVYTVPRTGHHIDPTTVRRHAAHTLPDYMVPAHIVVLDTMPLTPNGKVDRRALPPPDHTHTTPNGTPTTPQQATLCQLFADTLGLPHIGTHDNFFDHGGHSLLATRLISRIRTHLNHELTIRDLFEHPTVHDISNHLTTPTTPRPALRPMRPTPAGRDAR
ncbi:amino acid adenylation domain-containing protein [Streptomyces sp. YIM B13518]|uniref:amino acid adenylation domain-containing protein n=1 Tax=Streptomyces sp. YIM B13518 TaxID=3366316 RepID=UPI00369AC266